jgi:cell division initiation protein
MMTEENTNITPLDIKKKQFSTAFRGFDIKEVESFLEILTGDLEELILQREDLRKVLHAKEREVEEVKERESSSRKTLEGLQKILTEERGRAEVSGKQIVREAELKASEILMQSREEQISLQNEIQQLKRMRREFLAKVGSLVDSYKKIIEQDQETLDAEMRIDSSDVQMI